MSADTLIQKMRRQRELKIEVAEGKTITLLRPPEIEVGSLSRGVTLDHVRRYAVGWSGFTEADLLTAGGSEPVEFHVEIAAELLADHSAWLLKLQNGVIDAVNAHFEAKKAALGN